MPLSSAQRATLFGSSSGGEGAGGGVDEQNFWAISLLERHLIGRMLLSFLPFLNRLSDEGAHGFVFDVADGIVVAIIDLNTHAAPRRRMDV